MIFVVLVDKSMSYFLKSYVGNDFYDEFMEMDIREIHN